MKKHKNNFNETLGEDRFFINKEGVLCHLSLLPNGPLMLVNTVLFFPDGRCASDFGSTDYTIDNFIHSAMEGFIEISQGKHTDFYEFYNQLAVKNSQLNKPPIIAIDQDKKYHHRSMN